MIRRLLTASMLFAGTLALAPALALADQFGGQGHHGHMWGGGWGWTLFGPLTMIAVIAAIVALVVLLVRWLSGQPGTAAPSRRSALDVLEERFARGEIDKDEFEERRRLLSE